MDLHYSQTVWSCFLAFFGFTTLWIYTILKRPWRSWNGYAVLLPYGFTLFSNQSQQHEQQCRCFTTLWIYTILKPHCWPLAGCTGFTTLWIYTILKHDNPKARKAKVLLPYGFTLFSNQPFADTTIPWFYYLMDLHYSQTNKNISESWKGFTTLWIYTILKPPFVGTSSVIVLLPYGFTLFSN